MRNCVICKASFDEGKVDHLPDRDPKTIWTCSKVCQARLDKRAGAAQELTAAAAEGEPVDEEEEVGPSEAEKGRAALAELGGETPPAAAAGAIEYARAAKHLISAAEELSSPEDRGILLTLAHGFLGRAIGDGGPELEDGEEPPPAAGRPVGRARGSGGDEYIVSKDPAGALSCTCPGFKFRKTCRHVDEARRFPERFR